ncbi:sulfotransferase family protein [Membranihabitans maritimus]|uniref:sulfotransferase family protein n=1 Tax=Membranihabitans maritimus TaxID=2904244 RepID=UPI001F3FCB75|nr:sulfotransferase [Membranihabitans maritimus]
MILYIAGAGHSGSSLLDVILNNHPKIIGTGELHRLSLNPNTRICSCGELINDCPVWRKRIKQLCKEKSLQLEDWEMSFSTTYLRSGSLSNKINDLVYWSNIDEVIRIFSKLNPFSIGLKKSILNTNAIHEVIKSQENIRIVVDSTKNAIRMKGLNLFLDAKILFLVRDGRAVTASAIRRGEGNMTKVTKNWTRRMKILTRLQNKIPSEQLLQIKYEDLCTDPEGIISEICKYLSVEFLPTMLKIHPGNYHTIPGNPWLVNDQTSEITIKKDERWRNELTPQQLVEFEKVGGLVNRKLGYVS